MDSIVQDEEKAQEEQPKAKRGGAKGVLIAAVLYLLYAVFLPLVALPHLRGPLTAAIFIVSLFASTLIFMYLQLLFPQKLAELEPSSGMTFLGMLAGGALWLFDLFVIHPYRGFPGSANFTLHFLREPIQSLGITIGLSFAGMFLAKLVCRIGKQPSVLLPVALIAMPIDYIGAMTPTGFTQNMVAKHPEIVKNVSVSAPAMHGIPMQTMIGPGDVLFIAFFFAIVSNFKLNVKGAFAWMYGLLTLAFLLVMFSGLEIAALVPMGIAIIASNYKSFKLTRSEVFASIYGCVVVFALVVVFYVYAHRLIMGAGK